MGHNSIKVCGQGFTINGQVYTHPTHSVGYSKGAGSGEGSFAKYVRGQM